MLQVVLVVRHIWETPDQNILKVPPTPVEDKRSGCQLYQEMPVMSDTLVNLYQTPLGYAFVLLTCIYLCPTLFLKGHGVEVRAVISML